MNTAIVDRSRIVALEKDIVEFIPGARDLPPEARLALAHISLAHGLSPFLKEAWAIPTRDRQTGQIVGFEIMIGITGWRRSAHDSGEYWGRHFENCSAEERKALQAGPEDLAMKCIVMRRKTGQQPMEFDGYGIFRKGERTRMNPLQCVRIRAERDAMKAAFPITLHVPGGRVSIVDESGDVINGDVEHVPSLAALSDYESTPDLSDQPAPEPEARPNAELIPAPATASVPAPAPQPAKPRKLAKVAGSADRPFRTAADEWAQRYTRYAGRDGHADYNHILAAALAEGYAEITVENIVAALKQVGQRHAIETQAEEAA